MGFSLGDIADPGNLFGDNHGKGSVAGEFFGSENSVKWAKRLEEELKKGLKFEKEMAKTLRADAKPLRELRNTSLGDSLKFLRGDNEQFYDSAEYNTVRNAAMLPALTGDMPEGARNALFERAGNIALGEYQPYTNRIFNTAGITSQGLNNTNSILQQNADAQAAILGQTGAAASGALLDSVNSNRQGAMGLASLFASFSDERLKENIKYLYTNEEGIKIYSWDWKEEAKDIVGDQIPVGPIAQELLATHPERVMRDEKTGYYKVVA